MYLFSSVRNRLYILSLHMHQGSSSQWSMTPLSEKDERLPVCLMGEVVKLTLETARELKWIKRWY